MSSQHKEIERPKRILLTGVFGPYGVDDEHGRKENIIELFHNQVTKAQGHASLRFHHRTFGLYFIAENIDADVTVLDFPSRRRFEKELEKDYDIVGISFITPNFSKARTMAQAIRRISPRSKIVLGGHGAAIEGVEELIESDHVVKGEGISWFRAHLGQNTTAPIRHPVLPSNDGQWIFGVPFLGKPANLLVPGLGCVNGCRFCSTSHFFGKKYTSFMATGQELFDTACRIADKSGVEAFFVMDENFLKDTTRALEFLRLMEDNERYFEMSIFSSAEAITAFGVENLVRMGTRFVWVGVESGTEDAAYQKNRGIDPKKLIKTLRDRGISVLASGILCAEHHTRENIQTEIDFMVGLESDMVQYMLLTPLPTTALYEDLKARGLLRWDLPYEEWHGQKYLVWDHPEFPLDAAEAILNGAFEKEYEVNSSSIFRLIETSFRGYETLAEMPNRDKCLEVRCKNLRTRAREYSLLLPTIARNAVNDTEKHRARELWRRIDESIGKPGVEGRLKLAGIAACVAAWKARCALLGDRIQPRTYVTHYPAGRSARQQPPARLEDFRIEPNTDENRFAAAFSLRPAVLKNPSPLLAEAASPLKPHQVKHRVSEMPLPQS